MAVKLGPMKLLHQHSSVKNKGNRYMYTHIHAYIHHRATKSHSLTHRRARELRATLEASVRDVALLVIEEASKRAAIAASAAAPTPAAPESGTSRTPAAITSASIAAAAWTRLARATFAVGDLLLDLLREDTIGGPMGMNGPEREAAIR